MNGDIEIILIKIEQKLGRICKALEQNGNENKSEQLSSYLDHHFPSWKDNLAAQAWFDSYIEDAKTWNYGKANGDIIMVPNEAARSIFTLGWTSAMCALRDKVKS